MMAHSIAGRSQAPEKVTVTDLFYLRGLDVGSVNIPYLLARYLRRFAAGRKSGALISISRAFWTPGRGEASRIDCDYERAPGPERQPDAAVGALGAAEDSPAVDEGDQAVSAPVQGPPPPPAAVRTMPQRMVRLEEDVHEIRRALAEQREVTGAMARDFSRFTVWAASGIAQLLDSARVTYTPYFETHVPYQRRVRRRTDGASTSAAQQDQQQPDP
ncbi:hypothetical protein Tco_1190839 [Tanacetum coccineum]